MSTPVRPTFTTDNVTSSGRTHLAELSASSRNGQLARQVCWLLACRSQAA
ncbi:hypothetical protein MMSP_3851 [Mycobacterium sp. 012931]|nr:hypothetical protein MMSP_3851 [Mycobacterium sp. 012931]